MEKGRILVVDDELSVRDSLMRWFRDEGFEVGVAESANDALTRLAERSWDVALVDIKMRGMDGIELQRRMVGIDPNLIVIIMTGYASVDTAVAALKNGAYDYVTKPLDPDEIAHLIQNALTHRRTQRENVRMRETIEQTQESSSMIGQSAGMRRVFDAVQTVGETDATVLITGESGTGKELVAKAIHMASTRRYHPFVPIHCAALTETLLESELFGHEKGAFTGAMYRKKGKFEIAEGGSIFLDEVGDISLKSQTELLRVLQEREVTRVGGQQPIKVDFRTIAATNRPLEQMIEEGRFRPDLFYRLNVFRVELPALRDRRDDIPLLAEHFMRKYARAMTKQVTRISPEAMELLQQFDWPGNVRELENAIERAIVVAREDELLPEHFIIPRGSATLTNGTSLEEVERAHILRVVEEYGGNQTQAAKALGIDRVTLHNKLKRYAWTPQPVRGAR